MEPGWHEAQTVVYWWVIWSVLDWAWKAFLGASFLSLVGWLFARYRESAWQREFRGAFVATVLVSAILVVAVLVSKPTRTAQSLLAIQPPSVLLLPTTGQLNLFNRSPEDLQLWGDRLNDTLPDIGQPRIIPRDSFYHMFTDRLKVWALSAIGKDGDRLVPFEVYLSDVSERHYIAKFDLLIKMHAGNMDIHTQQLGVAVGEWPRGYSS